MAGSLGFNTSGELQVSGTVLTKNTGYKSTPVTVTSWSYVTTTITLNVASHTFLAGDYIEVGGLTATTNIPNGVHLVTSVTATTIVFTYALTPTGTSGVSSASVKGYMTTNGRTNGIGEGQTWQNLTASRVLGTVYINTTGKPITVIIHTAFGTVTDFQLYVNSVRVGYYTLAGGGTGSATLGIIVPNNSTYSCSLASPTISGWIELR